jgi:hypothetical protein
MVAVSLSLLCMRKRGSRRAPWRSLTSMLINDPSGSLSGSFLSSTHPAAGGNRSAAGGGVRKSKNGYSN